MPARFVSSSSRQLILAAGLLCAIPHLASAQTDAPESAPPGELQGLTEAAASTQGYEDPSVMADEGRLELKRPAPNYDGRGPEWKASKVRLVPRVLLFPFYAVNEYVLRRPMGLLLRWVERDNIPVKVLNALTWRHGTIGVFPAFKLTNGMKTTAGFLAFAKHPFVEWHSATLTTQTSFTRIVETVLTNRFTLSRFTHLDLVTEYSQRNDYLWYGIGPLTLKRDQTRFERRKPLALLELVNGAGARSTARIGDAPGANGAEPEGSDDVTGLQRILGGRLGVEISDNSFRCSNYGRDICGIDHRRGTADDETTFSQNGQAAYFAGGYSLLRIKSVASIDTRDPSSPQQTGVRFDAIGRYGKGLGTRGEHINFVRYGGELAGFLDISHGLKRVFAARLHIEMEDSLQKSGKIPFEELISLGGPEALRGVSAFAFSRAIGRSRIARIPLAGLVLFERRSVLRHWQRIR